MTIPALQRLVAGLLARQADHQALQLARHSLLDTAGCILTGRDSVQVKRLDAALAESCTQPAADALRNGTAAHAIDYDDYEQLASTHPSAVIVPAIAALAGRSNCTNAQVLQAYVSGFEAILSLGIVLGHQHYLAGWHATSTIGRVGAAMACSRLVGLDMDHTVSAMSLAMTQSAGMKIEFGTDAKALHAGLAARTGVEAALLARAGLTASANAGDGLAGFHTLYGTSSSPGWSALFEADFPRINDHPPYLKLSPSCGYTLRAIEAGELIHATSGFDHRAIDRVTIRIARPYYAVAGFDRPMDASEARFSVAYCVATALVEGRVGVAAFSPDGLQRSDVRHLLKNITIDAYDLDVGLGDMSPQAPETVSVQMNSGTRFVQTIACVRGGPGRLLSSGDVITKYVSCGGRQKAAAEFLQADLSELFVDPARQ